MVALPLLRPTSLRAVAVVLVVAAAPLLGLVPTAIAAPQVDVQMATHHLTPTATRDGSGLMTATVVADAPFGMVGMDLPHEMDVEVRVADGADGSWGPWTSLSHSHDEGPDPGGPERDMPGEGTHLLFTGAADRIQVQSDDPGLGDAEVVLIDPFGLSRSRFDVIADGIQAAWHGTPGSPAAASVSQPPIVTRAEWGADETIVRGPRYARQVDRVFVHHTVGSNAYSQAQAPGVVRGIQAYHVNSRGWSDIGYNFLVDRFGTIYEGRAGGIDRAVIGAQAGGFNTASSGVALMGTFTSGAPPAASVAAIEQLAGWLADVHHFDIDGVSSATSRGSSRYPEGEVVLLHNLSGHRDVSATSCPGDAAYPVLPGMRPRIDDAVGDQIIDHDVDVTTTRVIRGDPDAERITVSATMDPPGAWTVQASGPDGRVLLRATGDGGTAAGTLPLDGQDWSLGTYTFTIASPGRTTATTTAQMTPPVIAAPSATPGLVRAGADGVAAPPLALAATLWDQASWEVVVTDPSGALEHQATGTGARLQTEVTSFTGDPGQYGWTITAEDAEPASGSFELRYDILERVADTDDPVHASVLASRATFMDRRATIAVIARSDVFADALAGGPLAGDRGPLLLTGGSELDQRVADELTRVLASGATLYVLGGTQAISPAVVETLRPYGEVIRLAGASRTGTAAEVAAQVVARSGTTTAMIARSGSDDAAPWADALAGGAWGAQAGVPVLLTLTSRLSDETAGAIRELGITETIVLGGTAAVSDAAMAELPAPTRLAGADRHGTAAAVAEQLWSQDRPVTRVVLANGITGDAWAWALSAAPLAASLDAPLLLSGAATLPQATRDVITGSPIISGVVVGPEALVGQGVRFEVGTAARQR